MRESEIGKGLPQLTNEQFDNISMGDIDSDEIKQLCESFGIKISDNVDSTQEIMVDGKLIKMVIWKGDFGTTIDEDSVHAREKKKIREYEADPFSSAEFPAGERKKFIDLETSETREGKVVALKAAEGKKIVELEMHDGSIVEVDFDSIVVD